MAESQDRSNQEIQAIRQRQKLAERLQRLRQRVRLSRGRGGRALTSLLARLQGDEVEMDEETFQELTELLASLEFAIDDLKADKRRLKQQPWRRG